MPDLDTALRELRRFATSPPTSPPPMEELVEHAQHLRRRRRASAAVAVALLGTVIAVVAFSSAIIGRDSTEVRTVDDPADRPSPATRPVLTSDRSSVFDGESLTLSGAGFSPNRELYVTQCIRASDDRDADPNLERQRCDQARWAPSTTDGQGRFELRFRAYADVLTSDGWSRCDPCVVRMASGLRELSEVPIVVTVRGVPIRPTVRIVPAGPHNPGQRVTLEGSGFQARQHNVTIGWCGFITDSPETEIQGDPRNGYTPCVYPDEGFGVVVSDVGAFTVGNFPLPDGPFHIGGSADCSRPGTRCGLAWHPVEGSLPVFVTLFEFGR